MPEAKNYQEMTHYGKALKRVRDKHKDDVDACLTLDYMIACNQKIVRLLEFLSQHPGTWTDAAFHEFYVKPLEHYKRNGDNSSFDITAFRTHLDNFADSPGEKLQALKTYHKLLALLVVSLAVTAFIIAVCIAAPYASALHVGANAFLLASTGILAGTLVGVKRHMDTYFEPTIPANAPKETKKEQAFSFRFFGIDPVEVFDDALFTEVEREFHATFGRS